MPVRLRLDDSATRQEWLSLRRQGVGGSDAPIIMRLDQFWGPLSLYFEKVGESIVEDTGVSEAAYWGTVLEDVVAQEFAKRTGYRVSRPVGMVVHPQREWQLGTIDRLVFSSTEPVRGLVEEPIGLLEVKTTGVRREELWKDGPPSTVVCQVQHYLSVTELQRAWVAVLIGGQQFRMYELERDEEFIERMIKAEAAFWDRVVRLDPPDPEGADATSEIIDIRFPRGIEESMVELPSEALVWVATIEQGKQALAAVKMDVVKEAEQRLKLALGDAEYGTVDGRIVCTWKTQRRTSIDVKALRDERPDVAAEFTRITSNRVLRLTREDE